uniref:Immunoglobulin-binding protein 1 n=1 Tax=Pan paniscus TaxID=9597 RepID=A0A2R8Z6J8_PANPA
MAAEDELLLPRLPMLLETGKQLLDEVELAAETTGYQIVQEKVFKGLDLEEIAFTELKYLLVPALQGSTLASVLQRAREHFINYLTQCHYYHVAEFELPKTKNNTAENHTANSSMAYPSLVAMASQRQAKIEGYKQKKELDHRLSAMKSAVESGQADDEHVREYYLLHLQRWIDTSLEEIETSNSSLQERPPVKSFILTRNTAPAKLFGASYPSLATMTVNDWYEQHRKYGALPDQGIATATPEEIRKAAQQQKVREWDNWKDTHPGGYGNRQNMG